MMELSLYTVDRLGTLREGATCDLGQYSDISPPFLMQHVHDLFPDGVSRHGEQYFLRNESSSVILNPMLELTLEHVRRIRFTDKPSRFQSMFAVDTLDAATSFRNRFNAPSASIYKVTANIVFRGDMGLLHGGSILVASYVAHRYWTGEPHPQNPPVWEYLLKCPVTVGERVS